MNPTASLTLRAIDLKDKPARFAVFRALFLGDLLMTIPAFRALRHRFPRAEITLIGLPWTRSLMPYLARYLDRFVEFPGFPGLPEMEVVPERTAQWLQAQQAYGYDLALQLHGDGSVTNGVVAALGARLTAGYALPGDERLSLSLPAHSDGNEVLRWLRLVEAVGAWARGTHLDLPLRTEDKHNADALLSALQAGTGPVVGMHVGAKARSRRWPTEKFAELGDRLIDHNGARVVLTGSAGERDLTGSVARTMCHPVLDLAGLTELGTFAGVISRLDLLITNDTGASHVAAATRTRSIVLFGPEPPERFAPLDRARHTIIDSAKAAPAGTPLEAALQWLPVDCVFQTCQAVLRHALRPVGAGASVGAFN